MKQMEPKDLKWQMSIPCRVPGGVPWSLLFVTFLRLFTFILLSQWFLNLCVTRNPYWWAGGAWEFAFLARPGVGGVGSWCSWSGHPSVRTCALPGSAVLDMMIPRDDGEFLLLLSQSVCLVYYLRKYMWEYNSAWKTKKKKLPRDWGK